MREKERRACVNCIYLSNVDCVVKLLENGANVNCRDNDGQTPLHWAVDKEDRSMVQLLLANKADANAQDALKHGALHRAAALGLAHITRALLERGADVNLKNNSGWTAVHVACYYYHKDILAALLSSSYGYDIELANKDGWTSLHAAASQGHADVVQMLLAHNASVNARASDQSTPLHAACRHGHARAVKALLGAGAAPSLKDANGNTPRQVRSISYSLFVFLCLFQNCVVFVIDILFFFPRSFLVYFEYDSWWRWHQQVVKHARTQHWERVIRDDRHTL